MPINRNTFIIYDYETGSRNPNKTQPIQLAAIAMDPRTLTFIPGSEFNSMIQPIWDKEEQAKLELDDIEDGALEVNKKTREELKSAPQAKVVWNNFITYVKNFNSSGKDWDSPILVGYNNINFDTIINTRMAKLYGNYDQEKNRCNLFHPIHEIDVQRLLFGWFESDYSLSKYNLDAVRDFFGISKENAHDALQDVLDTGNIFARFLNLQRKMAKNVKWKK
jgi:DNA polymerase III epsilon subunit-like protein